jgi:hypothetical protein
MHIDAARSVDALSAETWSRVSGRCSVYSSAPWLRHLERREDATVSYLLARVGGETAAVLPTYLFTGAVSNPFYDPEVLFARTAPASRARPLLLGGTREGYTTEVMLDNTRPAGPPDDAVAGALVDGFRERARAQGAAGALLYLTDETVELLGPRLGPGDRLLVLDASASLPVPEGGCAEYIAKLTSKRRVAVRREIRRFQELGFRAEVESLRDCSAELAALSSAFLKRYGHFRSEQDEAARFEQQSADLGDLARIFTARKNGVLAGFVQFLEWNGVLYGRTMGLDDTVAREAALYFNLAYYSAIDYAAASGLTRIDYGCDSFEVKIRRGARLRPLWGLLLDQCSGQSQPRGALDLQAEAERRLGEFFRWDDSVITPTVEKYSGETARRVMSTRKPAQGIFAT